MSRHSVTEGMSEHLDLFLRRAVIVRSLLQVQSPWFCSQWDSDSKGLGWDLESTFLTDSLNNLTRDFCFGKGHGFYARITDQTRFWETAMLISPSGIKLSTQDPTFYSLLWFLSHTSLLYTLKWTHRQRPVLPNQMSQIWQSRWIKDLFSSPFHWPLPCGW